MISDEEFFAWLDGELDDQAAKRVAAVVAGDSELTARAERHRELAAKLGCAFTPVMDSDVPPPRFGAADVVDLQARRAERSVRRSSFGLPQWAAMAATLAIGIVAGQFTAGRSGGIVESRDGSLMATASLDRALGSRLASAAGDEPFRVALTFRDHDGAICRSFTEGGASGLACREGDGWRIDGLFAGQKPQTGDYRMAAGEDPRLAALIDDRIEGEPFDAAAERLAMDKGWR